MSGPRYGVISDVHANLPALEAVLAHLDRVGVDHLISLGDAIGYGPFPGECVELLADRDAVCITGNHEQIALGRLSDEWCTAAAKQSLAWTRTVLTRQVLATLLAQPPTIDIGSMRLAHGSPDRVDEYVRDDARAAELLDAMTASSPKARILLLGHTHEPWAHTRRDGSVLRERAGSIDLRADDSVLLNPGSVGQSRDRHPEARFLVLDVDRPAVDFYSISYDVEACRRALRQRGLPAQWCHVAPPMRERIRGAVGDSLCRVGLR